MGYASVSFGKPLSLAQYRSDHPEGAVEALGGELMMRISDVMPVLPVPLVSAVLLEADAPMERAAIETAVASKLREMGKDYIHLPRDDLSYTVEGGLRQLRKRKLVTVNGEQYSVLPDEAHVLRYYATSIAHLDAASAA